MSTISMVKEFLEISGKEPGSENLKTNLRGENLDRVKLGIRLIEEELQELKDAIATENTVEVLDAIIDIEYVYQNLVYFLGINEKVYNKLFNEVQYSNLSKFCSTEERAQESVEFLKSKGIESYYKYNQKFNVYVIYRSSDDKILKGLDFKSPDLSTILNKFLNK